MRQKAKSTRGSSVFEVQVAKDGTTYNILQCFRLCEVETTASSDVCDLVLAQNTATCDAQAALKSPKKSLASRKDTREKSRVLKPKDEE